MNVFHGEPPPDPSCKACGGKGFYNYDHNHGKICEKCCPHNKGFWLLTEGYSHAGKWCCKGGCGFTRDTESGDRAREE